MSSLAALLAVTLTTASAAADVVSVEGGVLRLSGTCIVDGVYKVGFEARADVSQKTFSLSLADSWRATGSLASVAALVP